MERSARSLFESELPARAMFELEQAGPISNENHGPPASSREMDCADFDDDDDDDNNRASSSVLELRMDGLRVVEEAWPKAPPTPRFSDTEERSVIRAIPPPPPSSLRRPTPIGTPVASSNAFRPGDTKAVIAAFAGFGAPPTSIWQTPNYALHVFRRRRELAQDLAYARRGRSPDVGLFETAMNAYDASAAFTGRAILGTLAFALAALSVAALVLM